MVKLKSARHHWWPEAVSVHWENAEGRTYRIDPDGKVGRSTPDNFGAIGNGHHVKMDWRKGEETVWDHSFEDVFQNADTNFPFVIEWLKTLTREDRRGWPLAQRFINQPANDAQIAALAECLISLAVRSPRTRETGCALAEGLQGPLPEKERNVIIGMNLRGCQQATAKAVGSKGKYVVIYSPDREFIFGDGFFHNITASANPTFGTKILAPLTPEIAVLLARPTAYRVEPRLMTLVISADEAKTLNEAVQAYSKNQIFYRSEAPEIIDAFRQREHLRYDSPRNPIDMLIDAIPGVQPRDLALYDFLEGLPRRSPSD